VQSLVDAGHLTDLDIYAPSSPDMTGAKTSRTAEGEQDYRQADIERPPTGRSWSGTSCPLVQAGAWRQNHLLCIVHRALHARGRAVPRRWRECRTPRLLHGRRDPADILDRFERGDFTVLSNVSLLSEGFDVPDTAA
jgi:hypothetical protein